MPFGKEGPESGGGYAGRLASFRLSVVIVLAYVTTLLAVQSAHTGESTLVRFAAAPGPITLGNFGRR